MLVFDFNFVLLCLLVLTLLLKVAGRFFQKLQNYQTKSGRTYQQEVSSWLKIFLFFLVLRGFLIEPFYIPSSSMTPNLYTGDLVLINRLAFGLRLPVWRLKLLDFSERKRGDIAVFHYPEEVNTYYVKRIVGLPKDHIRYQNKKLFVNGKQVTADQSLGYFEGYIEEPKTAGLSIYEEKNENSYQVIVDPNRDLGRYDRIVDFVVPENSYFTLGDNRDNSLDSRWWGVVPESHLVGKPFLIWFNWGKKIDWTRLFKWPK